MRILALDFVDHHTMDETADMYAANTQEAV